MAFLYRFSKARRLLKHANALYQKKGGILSESDRLSFESDMEKLDQALLNRNRQDADHYARRLEAFLKGHFPKSFFDHTKELIGALLFAILFAFIIRQFWFELYEVPTGSMRPTIEELDRLVVSKTTFGLNPPFKNDLILYKSEYLKRNGIIVFTVEDMDVADADTMYFYIFPGKKRYVKRCLGKPGDTLYFYGGRLYGIDSEGQPITDFSDEEHLKRLGIEKIDHVPYITMQGKTSVSDPLSRGLYGTLSMRQMNLPVGKLQVKRTGAIQGTFFNGKEWVKDNPAALKKPHDQPESYSDLWGIGNYAMARLLTPKEAETFYKDVPQSKEACLYLELHHTPNFTFPTPELRRGERGDAHPMLTPFTTLIPLEERHLKAIQDNLYTARFIIEEGHAYRYHESNQRPQRVDFDPIFPGVPNGKYEFYYGKGYKIHFGGIRTPLDPDHPLYNASPENIQKLFNLGIHFNIVFQPLAAIQPFEPQRFAYFRSGDLYLMGAPIFHKDDPILRTYVDHEMAKQEASSEKEPYVAFVDHGPPLKDGKLNVDFIKAFGLKIPEDACLALGDNYAMSADSREFGFVPIGNLRGAPSFTFWPPSSRVGPLPQPTNPWVTLPNFLIWGLAFIVLLILSLYIRKRNRKAIFHKKDFN